MKKLQGRTLSTPLSVVALVILAIVGVYLVFTIKQSNQVIETDQSITSLPSSPSLSSQPLNTSSGSTPDETANTKTYTNEKYSFSFKYPSDWEINLTPELKTYLLAVQKKSSSTHDTAGLKAVYLNIISKEEYDEALSKYATSPGKPVNKTVDLGFVKVDYWTNSSASTDLVSAYIPKADKFIHLLTVTEMGYDQAHQEKVGALNQILDSFKLTD